MFSELYWQLNHISFSRKYNFKNNHYVVITWLDKESYQSLVFPIQGKILKPGLQVAEKRNPRKPVFFGFEMNAILSDKTQYHCEINTVCPCAIH